MLFVGTKKTCPATIPAQWRAPQPITLGLHRSALALKSDNHPLANVTFSMKAHPKRNVRTILSGQMMLKKAQKRVGA